MTRKKFKKLMTIAIIVKIKNEIENELQKLQDYIYVKLKIARNHMAPKDLLNNI